MKRLSYRPHVFVARGFASDEEVDYVLSTTRDESFLSELENTTKHDSTGFSLEFPVCGHAVLESLSRRIQEVTGIKNQVNESMRFRRYEPGEAHPLHIDEYEVASAFLVATAIICLETPSAGGEVHFPNAEGGAVRVRPERGDLILWFNHRADGSPDPRALHEGLGILEGRKVTLTEFVYAPLSCLNSNALLTEDSGLRAVDSAPAADSEAGRFIYVNDGVPFETTNLMRAAAISRGLAFEEIHAPMFDFRPERQLDAGDILFRPAVSLDAIRVEQFLYSDGVSTLYEPAKRLFFPCANIPLAHQRAGLPIPRTIFCTTTDRNLLRSFVEQLGGFPIVVKAMGYSRGVGVMRVDSFPALFSLMDFVSVQGVKPLMCSYVGDAVHWRVVVVGKRAVICYKNCMESDDFRTYAATDEDDYSADVPANIAELAVRSVEVLEVEWGGVDILEHESGRLYLLEANFPNYFANAQQHGGVDIAGAIVDHLIGKAQRLLANPTQ